METHPAFKTNRSSGAATISVNPKLRFTGAAAISINPARHTSKANASRGEEDMIGDLVEKIQQSSHDSSLGQKEVSSGNLTSEN